MTKEVLHDKIKKEIMEIAENISEIVNNYKKLRNPLMESQEKVPQATEHLDKINEQTEAATQKMLDVVEKVTQWEEEVIQGLKSVKGKISGERKDEINGDLDSLIEKAIENNDDTFAIMDALQFQDITSQQLNYAVHMLVDLESKLSKVLIVMNGDEKFVGLPKKENDKARAYDPHADMYEKTTEQSDIDNIFAKK
jgi:chemotaxis regulatin CheY-phosphate phosphatase CheZ